MLYWKQQIISLLRDSSIEKCLLREFSRHAPGRDCSILLDAFKNYFSSNNPAFEQNWFLFPNGVTVVISREGIVFTPPSNATEEISSDCEYSQWAVCERITRDKWHRIFLGKYPDIED
jgi:hypothetical protein